MIDTKGLDNIIIGRVEPHIYAFSTNTIPNYLKIGDTYRPVNVRLDEWKDIFPTLEKKFEDSAKISDDIYFRDFSVHQFIENEKKRKRLQPTDIDKDIYYSKEFFKDTTINDIIEALNDIKSDFENKTQKYQFYNAVNKLPEIITFARNENYLPRPNQQNTIAKFKNAVATGRTNLLMYAVMRFGKSFTSMCCAMEIKAKLVVIVSAKADVKIEWKRTIESHIKFKDYVFLTSDDLKAKNTMIKDNLSNKKKVAIFLTLQDLKGKTIKDKHKEIFGEQIDLLLIDETHFGARAEKYGQVLKASNYEKDINSNKDNEDFIDIEEAEKQLKVLNAKIRLHLSGTPYRILMGSEFKKEDIIAFYQFTDIVNAQQKWIANNNKKAENEQQEDWDNPYYGFPQMVRFAFNLNESSKRKLEELKQQGISYALSALLKPKSIKKADNGDNKKFIFEKEVLDLLEVIDGSKNDNELLGFLNYDKIKEGKMCRHIVMVLPYCASCDAMEDLLNRNKSKFKNLNSYKIINISGVENPNQYKTTLSVKKVITNFESQGKKTITLTVNRMLTGSTVQEWDTMLYLKDTSSPQEYDQAIFRLQNQYIKTYKTNDGKTIKYNMKPQTLLVDFIPNRMFIMQEQKAQIYNVNIDEGGNNKLKQRIEEELKISPIITINSNKIKKIHATDILEVVSNYKMNKGIKDEVLEIPVDLEILNIPELKEIIEKENEISSKHGLSTPAHKTEDGGDDITIQQTNNGKNDSQDTNNNNQSESQSDEQKLKNSLKKKVQSYYTRILLFAFITNNVVSSLKEIVDIIDTENNKRIIKNLGLQKVTLVSFYNFYFNHNKWILRDLDYKIQDLNNLSHKSELKPEEKSSIAINKFGKLGDAVVITPSNICDDMVNLLPDKIFKSGKHILDIAGVSGEFATAIVKKMTVLGMDNNIIKNSIYTIPKTSICYELTRKVYEMLNININNIATFYSEDLLKIKSKNDIDYDKINNILTQNKKFSEIKLTDIILQGGKRMKFGAIVGNPPYQETVRDASEGNNKNTIDIFNSFQDLALHLSDETCMIYPAKDYQRGKKSTKDTNLVYLRIYNGSSRPGEKHIPNEDSIFGNAVRRIPGDVGIFYFNKNNNSNTIKYQDEAIVRTDKILPVCKELIPIANKIIRGDFKSFEFSEITKVCESNFVQYNKESILLKTVDRKNISPNGYVKVLTNDKAGSGGSAKWFYIKKDKLNRTQPKKYKIVISSAYPNESFNNDENFEVLAPDEFFGRSKLSIYDNSDLNKVNDCLKYLQTKFAKIINAMTPYKFLYYLPDFNYIYNDIDWSKSIAEIDKQLYQKYNFSKEEIDYIEQSIKSKKVNN